LIKATSQKKLKNIFFKNKSNVPRLTILFHAVEYLWSSHLTNHVTSFYETS